MPLRRTAPELGDISVRIVLVECVLALVSVGLPFLFQVQIKTFMGPNFSPQLQKWREKPALLHLVMWGARGNVEARSRSNSDIGKGYQVELLKSRRKLSQRQNANENARMCDLVSDLVRSV